MQLRRFQVSLFEIVAITTAVGIAAAFLLHPSSATSAALHGLASLIVLVAIAAALAIPTKRLTYTAFVLGCIFSYWFSASHPSTVPDWLALEALSSEPVNAALDPFAEPPDNFIRPMSKIIAVLASGLFCAWLTRSLMPRSDKEAGNQPAA